MPEPRRSSLPLRFRTALHAGCVLTLLSVTACALTPQQQAEQDALKSAQTGSDYCYSPRYNGLLAEAWQRARDEDNGQKSVASTPAAALPPVQVTAATPMPDINVPPYSRRSCRMTIKVGNAAPETGFLTFTYLVKQGKTQSALAEWYSDAFVEKDYNDTMKEINSGLNLNEPELKACIARHPEISSDIKDPMVQKAAFDLRAHLVRRCMATKAALKNLYSDLYFIRG
ncbi:hypothetical protein [Acetobacter sp.]|uniref:hypothetical protein n=1 Tax=Acetobacter sp. TaxID=440 RepID=UPI0039ED7D53